MLTFCFSPLKNSAIKRIRISIAIESYELQIFFYYDLRYPMSLVMLVLSFHRFQLLKLSMFLPINNWWHINIEYSSSQTCNKRSMIQSYKSKVNKWRDWPVRRDVKTILIPIGASSKLVTIFFVIWIPCLRIEDIKKDRRKTSDTNFKKSKTKLSLLKLRWNWTQRAITFPTRLWIRSFLSIT